MKYVNKCIMVFLLFPTLGYCASADLAISAKTTKDGIEVTIKNLSDFAGEYKDVDGIFRESIYIVIGASRMRYMDQQAFNSVTKGNYQPRTVSIPAKKDLVYKVPYSSLSLVSSEVNEDKFEYRKYSDDGFNEIGFGYVAGPVAVGARGEIGPTSLWAFEISGDSTLSDCYPWRKLRVVSPP